MLDRVRGGVELGEVLMQERLKAREQTRVAFPETDSGGSNGVRAGR